MSEHTSDKSMIIFVHGFTTVSDTWKTLENHLLSSTELKDGHDIYSFDCTPIWQKEWMNNKSFENIYSEFDKWVREENFLKKLISSPKNHKKDLFLIGCGLGSLVVLNHLRASLNREEINFDFLRSIREIILISPPISGISIQDVRSIVSEKRSIFQKSKFQNKSFVNFLNNEISTIYNYTIENIVNAESYKKNKCPIPIAVIANEDDNFFVPKPIWANSKAWINISNNKIIRDTKELSSNEVLFEELKKLIYNPIGHRNIFEIERRESFIKVEPFLEGKKVIKFGSRSKVVECNSKAISSRKVQFSKNNICHKPFTIRYATTAKGGGLIGRESPQGRNIASAEKKNRYLKDAKEYVFEFIPRVEDSEIYFFEVEVYKGMDLPDNTNVHFHLYKGISFYNLIKFKFDLSKYLEVGYKISRGPYLYLISEDLHDCNQTYKDRVKENLINPSKESDEIGIWEWEFTKQRTGVVDLVWGIEEKEEYEKEWKQIKRITTETGSEKLKLQEKLVETLYRCDSLALKDRRESLIRSLPYGGKVNVTGTALVDIYNIVEYCGNSKERFDDLLESLRFFDGLTYIVSMAEDQIEDLLKFG